MPRTIRIAVTILWVLLCSACGSVASNTSAPDAASLWEHPNPKPDFVSGITRTVALNQLQSYCGIELNGFQIWERGDSATALIANLEETTEIVIDGTSTIEDINFGTGDAVAVIENNQEAGSFFGYIVLCFDVSMLDVGLHTAKVELRSTSGNAYEHIWAFEIAPAIN
ncbi:MAG: hypothetical protein KC547_17745 [Anaerolineae bacterium]|nr:hypothetical protein [Anaerolineae bacterium]